LSEQKTLFAFPLTFAGRAFARRGGFLGGRNSCFVAVGKFDIETRPFGHLGRPAQGFAAAVAHQREASRQNLGVTKTEEQFFLGLNVHPASRRASIPGVRHAFRQTFEVNAGIAHVSDARRSGSAKSRGKVFEALLSSVIADSPATQHPLFQRLETFRRAAHFCMRRLLSEAMAEAR
jgi:hypothetical protein